MVNKKLTWSDLDGKIPDCTLGRLMDTVEEETGKFPKWDEIIPEWVNKLI